VRITSDRAATVIIAWKKLSRRSELLSKALDAKLWFFSDNVPYARASLNTLRNVVSQKPKIIIVQLPQGPLLLETFFLKKIMKCKIIADVHTGFLVTTEWKGLLLNVPFLKFLHVADLIVAHNDFQLNLIPSGLRGKTLVVFDPWHLAVDSERNGESVQGGYIVFPASFASDEPFEEVIHSINLFNIDVKMYITGNWKRQPKITKYASDRIIFTGYLPSKEYNKLLSEATAIITGTKREYTSLMSGWEAVAYAKPLALTGTGTLKSLFKDYAVFYDWKNNKSIAEAIKKILTSKPNTVAREKLRLRTLGSIKMLVNKLEELDCPSSSVKYAS
jgi:glycosyltransferase involved in cell wall biosynthesis